MIGSDWMSGMSFRAWFLEMELFSIKNWLTDQTEQNIKAEEKRKYWSKQYFMQQDPTGSASSVSSFIREQFVSAVFCCWCCKSLSSPPTKMLHEYIGIVTVRVVGCPSWPSLRRWEASASSASGAPSPGPWSRPRAQCLRRARTRWRRSGHHRPASRLGRVPDWVQGDRRKRVLENNQKQIFYF